MKKLTSETLALLRILTALENVGTRKLTSDESAYWHKAYKTLRSILETPEFEEENRMVGVYYDLKSKVQGDPWKLNHLWHLRSSLIPLMTVFNTQSKELTGEGYRRLEQYARFYLDKLNKMWRQAYEPNMAETRQFFLSKGLKVKKEYATREGMVMVVDLPKERQLRVKLYSRFKDQGTDWTYEIMLYGARVTIPFYPKADNKDNPKLEPIWDDIQARLEWMDHTDIAGLLEQQTRYLIAWGKTRHLEYKERQDGGDSAPSYRFFFSEEDDPEGIILIVSYKNGRR